MGVEQLICSLGYAGCSDQSQSLHIRSVSYHQITARGQLRSIGTQDFAIFEFRFFGLELKPLLYIARLDPCGLLICQLNGESLNRVRRRPKRGNVVFSFASEPGSWFSAKPHEERKRGGLGR